MGANRVLIVAIVLLHFTSVTAQADKVDDYITSEMKNRRIPGLALAVIKNGEVIKTKGYGFANVELDDPVTPDTVFRLASMTKQFTATAIMLLVEKGKVGLDDKITKYLPNSPDTWSDITVRHLLTHTAGLKGSPWRKVGNTRLTDYTTDQIFEYISELPLDFVPGERWRYSCQGYFLLGMIIEQVSGNRWHDFLSEHIFQPLGMTATTVLDQWEIIKNRAAGYTLRGGKLAHLRRNWQDELPSGTGILSTVQDLAKWDAALFTEKILNKSSLDPMWNPVKLNNGFTHGYGFGWFLDEIRKRRVIGHGGGTGTYILRLPDDQLTVIVLTNLTVYAGSEPSSIAQGVAGRYIVGFLSSSMKEQPDPDPQRTQKMRKVLSDIAKGVKDLPLLTPAFNDSLIWFSRFFIASWLKNLQSFTFVACDNVEDRQIDRFGVRVSRVCYYKLVNALETRYLSFYLTSDAKVADVQSSAD